MGSFSELVKKNRSFRRFDESDRLEEKALLDLVELSRFCASGANGQPLKYMVAHTAEDCSRIFPHLRWAGALPEWVGPAEGERPTGYIIILGDRDLRKSFGVDPGIVAQTMLLSAAEQGYGGCMIGAIAREPLREALDLPERYEISLIVAFGKPGETVVIEDMAPGDSVDYYRDENDVHHVPKRTMEELIYRG